MKKLKQLWNYLNGKKTTIGMLLMLLAQGIQAFVPDLMTPEQIQFLQTTGTIIGGAGVIHKAGKTKQVQQLIRTKPKEK